MSPTATEQYVNVLQRLKSGDLGLLRTHAGQGLDESVHGFDLFAGLWWPLQNNNPRAPRREVAWLVAKLYAFRPIAHSRGETLARQLARCQPRQEPERQRYRQRIDRMLMLPITQMEPALQWALGNIASNRLRVDWVRLTNELSLWERGSIRRRWAEQFLESNERG